jgi:hypothetical protein
VSSSCSGYLLLVVISAIGLTLGLALLLNWGGIAKSLTVFRWLRVTAGWTWTWRLQGAVVLAISVLGFVEGFRLAFDACAS